MPDDRICGLNAVAALFARRPADVNRLYYTDVAKEAAGPFCAELARMRRPYRMLPDDEMQRAAGTLHHGGICALCLPRDIPMLDWAAVPRHKLVLVLDGIGNPHNLGAIARSAAFFGAGALILHERPDQAMPSDAAHRVAEGAMEHLDLYRTRALRNALLALDPHYRTIAATLGADAVAPATLPRDRPVALVLGNEEHGVSMEALATCRRRVRIPGNPAVQSLNVAQAAPCCSTPSAEGPHPMRIHLQSHLSSPSNFPLDEKVWTEAAARVPDVSGGHQVSFGGSAAEFLAAAPEVEILISQTAALAPLLPIDAPKLKMVFCTSAGLEKLAPFDWLPPGVPILNNRGTHSVKAGEYGIMTILMLASRMPALLSAQRDGVWRPLHGSVLGGRHVVIVGLGALGGSIAAQAKHFGMKVTGVRTTASPHPSCDRVIAFEELDSVLPDAEFLLLACPSRRRPRACSAPPASPCCRRPPAS